MPFIKRDASQDGRPVLLSEGVVRGLRQLAIDGLVALPRRGIEVGGVLLGIDHADEVGLDGFEEVPCEHRYGPSYALSDTDKANLHQLLATWPREKSTVVGFFRSFTSREPLIEEADEAFVREHFPIGWFVYLMLQPLSVENCVARFRFFRDGCLLPDTDDLPWRFAVTDHAPVPPADPLEPSLALPAHLPLENAPRLPSAIARRRLDADERNAAPLHRARWWVPALICLVSVAAGALINQMTNAMRMPATEPRWVDLHVDARPSHGQLEVRWDASQQATRGRLEVLDGDSHRDIELGPEQLREGKLIYEPSAGDVRLRLSLYAKGSEIAGGTVRLMTIPELTIADTKSPGRANLAASSSKPPSAEPPAGASARPPKVAVVPAEVHKVEPQIPEGIRSRIVAPVIIPVEVEVSERGKVVRAVAEKKQLDDGVHRYLAEQAEKAALKWRFRPAQAASGDRVATNKTLRFVFTPQP